MPIRQQPNEVQLRLVIDMIVSSGANEIHLMRGLRSFRHLTISTGGFLLAYIMWCIRLSSRPSDARDVITIAKLPPRRAISPRPCRLLVPIGLSCRDQG